jgi:hypothetical protein
LSIGLAFFDGVRVPGFGVFVAIATLTKGFATKTTSVRFLARMDELVVFQGVRPIEPLAAIVATVASLAAVDQPVLVVDCNG